MNKNLVSHEVDLLNPPPLTDQQRAEIAHLKARQGQGIDYSEIPPLDDGFWKTAVRNPFCKPVKPTATIRVDSDVLSWLKKEGRGYQARANAILRDAMLRSQQHA